MSTAAEVLKKCYPNAYFDQYILEGVLPDGRKIKSYRPIRINPGINWQQQRSVMIEHGAVVISITGELILQRANDSPMLKFKLKCEDKQNEDCVKPLSETLKYLASMKTFFNNDELKSEEEELRWQLKVTITVYNADGFVMDAILIGSNALFAQIKIPKVQYNWLKTLEKSEQTIDAKRIQIFDDNVRQLKITDTPVFSAFCLYTSNVTPLQMPILIVDPPSELVALSKGTLELIHISGGRIIISNIRGNVPLTNELFEEAAQLSADHYAQVSASLKKYSSDVCSSH